MNFGAIKHYEIQAVEADVYLAKHQQNALTFRLFETKDVFKLHELRKSSQAAYEETVYDTAQLIESQANAGILKLEHQVYVAEQDGTLLASVIAAVPGKLTAKLQPFIVEWNGDASITTALIAYIMKKLLLTCLNLHSPWHEHDMHQALSHSTFTKIPNQGTIKVIDPIELWKQLMPYLMDKSPEAASAIQLTTNNDSNIIQLTIKNQPISISYEEFIKLLFEPDAEIASLQPYQPILNSLFPIIFPYTAGLHYI